MLRYIKVYLYIYIEIDGDDVINKYKSSYIDGIKKIIKNPLKKISFYGKSGAQVRSNNQYLYLLGDKQIAVIYTNKTDNTEENDEQYDVFKLIYNYDLVKDNTHVLKVTDLDYEKSSFLLSSYTAKNKYGCTNFNSSVPHNFSEKVCEKEAIRLTYIYPTSFIAIIENDNTVKSDYFQFSLNKRCIITIYIYI